MLAFAISRIYLLYGLEPAGSDLPYYALIAYRAVDQKLEGFLDFPVEYPPVAYWSIVIPRQLNVTFGRPQKSLDAIYKRYQSTFRAEAFLFDLWSFLLFLALVRARRESFVGTAAWGYVLGTSILGHLLYDRLDIGLLFFFLLWATCWLRADEEPASARRWAILAGFVLGFSIAYKLIPILLLPIVVITERRTEKGQGRPFSTLAATCLGVALPFLWHLPRSGMKVFDFLDYHSGRLIDVNSVYGTVLILLAPLLGEPVTKQEGASWDMVGPGSAAMTVVGTGALFLFLLGATIYAALRKGPMERADGFRIAMFVIPTAVFLAKVLSPQYFLFVLPISLLGACETMKKKEFASFMLLGALLAAMSTWIYPYHFFSHFSVGEVVVDDPWGVVPDFTPVGRAALVMRNGAFGLLIGWLAVRFALRESGR